MIRLSRNKRGEGFWRRLVQHQRAQNIIYPTIMSRRILLLFQYVWYMITAVKCPTITPVSGAYRGGFPGVSGNPFVFYTPNKILKLKVSRIWNLWTSFNYKLLP